jgi:hypothetical protein
VQKLGERATRDSINVLFHKRRHGGVQQLAAPLKLAIERTDTVQHTARGHLAAFPKIRLGAQPIQRAVAFARQPLDLISMTRPLLLARVAILTIGTTRLDVRQSGRQEPRRVASRHSIRLDACQRSIDGPAIPAQLIGQRVYGIKFFPMRLFSRLG